MTPEQIDYLPLRIKTFADDIERLNKHPLLRPDTWIHGRNFAQTHSKGVVDRFGKLLMGLPFLLRAYAGFINGHKESMGRYLRENSRTSPRTQVVAALISLVRRETGRPRYKELSIILNAAARGLGLAESAHAFDETALKVLDGRMQKKQKNAPSP
jgi:hypothetical protein